MVNPKTLKGCSAPDFILNAKYSIEWNADPTFHLANVLFRLKIKLPKSGPSIIQIEKYGTKAGRARGFI